MREYGYAYAIIGWESEAEQFYRKTVGAEFIKGGNPENSVYSHLFLWIRLVGGEWNPDRKMEENNL